MSEPGEPGEGKALRQLLLVIGTVVLQYYLLARRYYNIVVRYAFAYAAIHLYHMYPGKTYGD